MPCMSPERLDPPLSSELPPSLSPLACSPFSSPRSPPNKRSAFAGGFPCTLCFLQHFFLLMFLGDLEKAEYLHLLLEVGLERGFHLCHNSFTSPPLAAGWVV